MQEEDLPEAASSQLPLGSRLQQQGAGLIGAKIFRLWPEDGMWYTAEITNFNAKTETHRYSAYRT